MSRKVLVIACSFFASPAMAFDTTQLPQVGSLNLADITALVDAAPTLKDEVARALAEAGRKPDDVLCYGMRFPWGWEHLAGERVAPYTCEFAKDKWLQIRASVRLTGQDGRVYDTASPEAMKNAAKVSETDLAWEWSAKDPSEGK